MDLFRWTLVIIGHIGLWCSIFNLIHSTSLPRIFRKRSERAILLAITAPILFFLAIMILRNTWSFDEISRIRFAGMFLYAMVGFGAFFMVTWLYRKLTTRLPWAVEKGETQWFNLREEIGGDLFGNAASRAIGQLPLNQCLKLTLEPMSIKLDIPRELDGLKICQLSDLHFTGQINVEYFQRVVEEANKFQPDLIFITGDLVDEAKCLPWLETTLGRLQAKHGVYYVLGNHDLRIKDETGFRNLLQNLGLTQASGKWHDIEIDGVNVRLTGNELPWYPDVEKLGAESKPPGLKILLSHSPDQLDWAKTRGFDLMFAGHTHGGQIALPIVGPIVAPSKYGVLYAAGTFEIEGMIMHVSRGISGDEPIRICCPPEVGLFTIQSSRAEEADKAGQADEQTLPKPSNLQPQSS